MAQMFVYLNFERECEEAFALYQSVFGTEFSEGPQRFGEMPAEPGAPEMSEADKKLIMHIALPLFEGYTIRGSDAPKSMGYDPKFGNNLYIQLELDEKAHADRIWDGLKEGGKISMDLEEQFWGDYFGDLTDKFGVQWMISCPSVSDC
jgi:PhnB protein